MTPNIFVLVAAAFIPFFVAYAWFHKSVFGGDKWHAMSDMPVEKTKTPVTPIKLALSIVLNFLIAFGTYILTIHESGVFGMVGGEIEPMKSGTAAAFLAEYGGRFHTFGHGVAHGLAATLLFALPILGYVTIFEKKSTKYFLVYLGYWYVCLTLISILMSLWGANPV